MMQYSAAYEARHKKFNIQTDPMAKDYSRNVKVKPSGRIYYPWELMSVGDSFLVVNKEGRKIYNAMWRRMKKHGGRYSFRTKSNGVRVFKVGE